MNASALVSFLQELADNNNKAWFDAHRSQYQALRQEFTDLVGKVIAGIGAVDEAVLELDLAKCMFRINRDVRFSRDKSPYKTQFSAAIGPQGRSTNLPAYYFQIDAAGNLFLGLALYLVETPELPRTIGEILRQSSGQGQPIKEHLLSLEQIMSAEGLLPEDT